MGRARLAITPLGRESLWQPAKLEQRAWRLWFDSYGASTGDGRRAMWGGHWAPLLVEPDLWRMRTMGTRHYARPRLRRIGRAGQGYPETRYPAAPNRLRPRPRGPPPRRLRSSAEKMLITVNRPLRRPTVMLRRRLYVPDNMADPAPAVMPPRLERYDRLPTEGRFGADASRRSHGKRPSNRARIDSASPPARTAGDAGTYGGASTAPGSGLWLGLDRSAATTKDSGYRTGGTTDYSPAGNPAHNVVKPADRRCAGLRSSRTN